MWFDQNSTKLLLLELFKKPFTLRFWDFGKVHLIKLLYRMTPENASFEQDNKPGTAQVDAAHMALSINRRTFCLENFRSPDKMFGIIAFLYSKNIVSHGKKFHRCLYYVFPLSAMVAGNFLPLYVKQDENGNSRFWYMFEKLSGKAAKKIRKINVVYAVSSSSLKTRKNYWL